MKTLRDTWLVYQRAFGQSMRNPMWVFIGLLQPIFYLVLFGPLLTKITGTPGFGGDNSYAVFVPGLLIQLAFFGAIFVGFGLLDEIRHGVIERMRVTPVSRLALLLGRALRDLTVGAVQALILLLIALPFGLRASAGGAVIAFALVLVIGLACSAGSYAVALLLNDQESFASLLNGLALPLLLLSGVLLPLSLGPGWLRRVAEVNPLSYAVDASRTLFTGTMWDASVARGVAVTAAAALLAVWWAARAFGRSAA